MKTRTVLAAIAALCVVALTFTPAGAATVYVTYTGTVRATDPTQVFGQGTAFSGIAFVANFVFDTGSTPDSPNGAFVFGGTNFNLPSPLVGPAVLTIGNVSVNINGDQVAEIFGHKNSVTQMTTQLHEALRGNGPFIEFSIFNYAGVMPATIATPFVYHKTPDDGGIGDFCYFGACGEFNVATLQYALTQPGTAPLPAALPLFVTGLGALGVLGWCRKRKA
jgi:hypothetical protein